MFYPLATARGEVFTDDREEPSGACFPVAGETEMSDTGLSGGGWRPSPTLTHFFE